MTTFLTIIGVWFGINAAFVLLRLRAVAHFERSDEQQWLRLHPGMPISRRNQ